MGKVLYLLLFFLLIQFTLGGISNFDRENRYKMSTSRYSSLKSSQDALTSTPVNEDDITYVHIVPHTHDDAGWLKTVDEYYSGDRNDICLTGGVNYILDGIYDTLMKNPERKFTYVEMVFFTKWWHEQETDVQENVKMLVKEGRLTFVNGGWSMSDEANVNYEDFINNMKAGHDFLKETFDYKPTIGWHIDPFGHQSATAALFAEMGFDAWFFARGDYQDKEVRMEEKSLEFLWRPLYENLGNRTEIFTHWMFDMYFPPHDFTFEEEWGNSPIVDNPEFTNFNVDQRIEDFEIQMRDRASHYRSNHVLAVFGQDFSYLNAQKTFKNIDKLIYHFNKKFSHMKLIYSTPYDYINSVHASKTPIPTSYSDMLPYASAPHDYWTGYYTSRANFKSFVKYSASKFNTYSSLFTPTEFLPTAYTQIFQTLGVSQHHDAVAGTAKEEVMEEYGEKLYEGMRGVDQEIFKEIAEIYEIDVRGLDSCIDRNSSIAECPTNVFKNEGVKELELYVTSQVRDMTVLPRIPLPDGNFTFEWDGIQPDITCNGPTSTYAFLKVDIKRGEILKIKIKRDNVSHCAELLDPHLPMDMKFINITYKSQIGDYEGVFEFQNKITGVSDTFSTTLESYDAFQNTSEQCSGAYIFRPKSSETTPFRTITDHRLFCGQNVCVLMIIGAEATNIMILNNYNDFIRFETVFNGIPHGDQGKEVVMKIKSQEISNHGVFYTDSMGLELQERVVDHRDNWELEVSEPVAGNYYPVNNLIRIHDGHMAMEVINDRPQGGTSLRNGEIELMIQRRLYVDDLKGVDEPLNESQDGTEDGPGAKVKLYTYFRITSVDPPEPVSYMKADLETPAIEVFSYISHDKDPHPQNLKKSYPWGLKILSFPEGNNTIFFRVENILEKEIKEETYTVNAFDIAQEFSSAKIESLIETSLTGNFAIEELQGRLKWEGEDFTSPPTDYTSDLSKVTLEPQRIRSFRVKFASESTYESA